MATISRFPLLRHLRGEPSAYGMLYKNGKLKKEGAGLTTWFLPLGTSLVEVPLNDREVTVFLEGTSSDYQNVNVNAVVSYRILEPQIAAGRVDFSLSTKSGIYKNQPLETLTDVITYISAQAVGDFIVQHPLKSLLETGLREIRDVIDNALSTEQRIRDMGLEIVSVGVGNVSASPEMEKALQVPERERIQQTADEASFARRAMAVENERAIQENELNNKIKLARQKEMLLEQEGKNTKQKATDAVEAKRIHDENEVSRRRMYSEVDANSTRVLEEAKNEAEKERMDIYKDLPASALMGLAARELAGKLETIEHLSLSPDTFGPLMQRLLTAGTQKLETQNFETQEQENKG